MKQLYRGIVRPSTETGVYEWLVEVKALFDRHTGIGLVIIVKDDGVLKRYKDDRHSYVVFDVERFQTDFPHYADTFHMTELKANSEELIERAVHVIFALRGGKLDRYIVEASEEQIAAYDY